MSDRDYRKELTENIIAELEKGTAPWQVPWDESKQARPMNAITHKRYSGVNSIHLEMAKRKKGYTDPRWCTYKQAQEQGWQVNKNEKGTPIEFWKFSEARSITDGQGKPVLDEKGQGAEKVIARERPLCRYYSLFNANQISGIPEMEKGNANEWPPEQRAENILKESGAIIFHDQESRAFYSPRNDTIHLPPQDFFKSPEKYYSTALHELGHWTGHETRLNWQLGTARESDQYAREELRAELASYFLSDRLNISNHIEDHAAYVQDWVKVLKEDKNEIFRASRDAEKITEHVMSYEKELKFTLNMIKENHKQFLALNEFGSEQARQVMDRQGTFLETALRERLGPLVERGMGKRYGSEWRHSERFGRDQETVRTAIHNRISQVFSRRAGINPDAVRRALERADQRGGLETFIDRSRRERSDHPAGQETLKGYTAIIKSPHETQEYRVEIFVDKNLEGKKLISALQQQTKKYIQEHPAFAQIGKAQVTFEKSKDLDLSQKINIVLKR